MEKPSNIPTILFQPPNRIGLGHMNRLACIAQALHVINPRIRTPFVVEGSSHSFLESKGLPVIPLPSRWEMLHTKAWKNWKQDDRKLKAAQFSSSILDIYKPDLVVYDCFPSPSFISSTVRLGIPSAICCRRVKDFTSYAALSHVKLALDSSKLILIPHESSEFAIPEEYANKSVYVGEIVQSIQNPNPELERRYRLNSHPLIIITGGGGGYIGTVEFYNVALHAFSILRSRVPKVQCILMVGPLFNEWLSLEVLDGVKIVPFEPMLASLYKRASVVVAQAGYNSIEELKLSGAEAVIVPGVRDHDDQAERAAKAMANTANMTYIKDASAESLAEHIVRGMYRSDVRPTNAAPLGAPVAAAELLEIYRRL